MEFVEQAAAVTVVLALLGGTLWWLRRRGLAGMLPGRKPANRRMQAVERTPLGPHHVLHLVRVGETALVLACSPGGCGVAATMPWSEVERQREETR